MKNIELNRTKSSKSFRRSVVTGVVIGIAISLILTVLLAAVMTAAELKVSSAKAFATVIIAVSALVSGFASAKLCEQRLLAVGTLSGVIYYIVVAVIAAAVTQKGFTAVFVIRLAVSASLSAVGALLSALNKTKTKKYI